MSAQATGPTLLAGQVVAVTGAARGIGAELARQATAAGARVALLGLEPAELAAVAAGCGPDARWWEVDVTDGPAMTRTAAEVAAAYGRVDVLVVNAGIAAAGTLAIADPAGFDRTIEVNLLGSVRTVRAFLPHLVDSRGHVLQIASLAALLPAPLMGAYCASKSGVEAFARSLRGEVAHQGVTVGVAYLTWTDTDMVRGADRLPGLAQFRAELPWPLSLTYPLGPAVATLVRGIGRRSVSVYAPYWLRGLYAARTLLPALSARYGARGVPRVEAELRAAGSPGGVPIGAPVGSGGAADRAARANS